VAGGDGSAAIGAGPATAGNQTVVEEIVIDGGDFAAGGGSGAAIGGGYADRGGVSKIQRIWINGGTLNASGSFGSGIGTGFATDGGVSSVAELVIRGGIICADARDGAGIGAGPALGGSSIVENLTILNGTFYVSGNWGAGIGTSSVNSGSSVVASLVIANGTFRANGSRGSGIGSAWVSTGTSSVNSVTILNGTFDVQGANDGAGIGSGPGQAGRSAVTAVSIKGGIIRATGTNAGIGVGSLFWSNTSAVSALTIGGASISTRGVLGFSATQVSFAGGNAAFSCVASGSICVNASSTAVSVVSVTGTTNGEAFGRGGWSFAAGAAFYGQYTNRSVREGFDGHPFVHVANVSAPRTSGLLLSVKGGSYERTVPFAGTGFILSLPTPGAYRILALSQETGDPIGELCVGGQNFKIEAKETLFDEAVICSGVTSPAPTGSKDPHELSLGLTIAIASVLGACLLGLILLCACLLRKKKSDQLLPGSGFYKP
jgi:hypothetical protein